MSTHTSGCRWTSTTGGMIQHAQGQWVAAADYDEVVKALRLSERRIVELCDTVNVLAKFRKVSAEDYAEDARAALKAAGVEP